MPFFGVPIRNGLPIGLGSSAGFGVQPFDPSYLFAAGEQGFFYDPSDLSTLFQDSAGTTPVTGVEQVVGLMLDKSKGLVLGPEEDPGLANYINVLTGTWLASGANYVFTDTVGGQSRPGVQWPSTSLAAGWYKITVVVSSITGATQIRMDGIGATDQLLVAGTNTFFVNVTTLSRPRFRLEDLSTTIGDGFALTSVSVRELPGNHATSTGAARPTLSARVNLLTKTEQFDDGVWQTALVTVTANTFVAPDGSLTADTLASANGYIFQQVAGLTANTVYTGSIYLYAPVAINGLFIRFTDTSFGTLGSGVYVNVTSGWNRFTFTDNIGANTTIRLVIGGASTFPNGTSMYAWGADLRVANDGVGIPTYQRVNTATDYDSSGFPLYLRFGGTQAMSTGSIDFTATDKMSVFAGVRKLSDAAGAILTELSANYNTNIGSFIVVAPDAGANYAFGLKGTFNTVLTATTFASPITNVLSCGLDIAEPTRTTEITPRVNAATPTLTGGGNPSAGTGNFGTYPLFIGSRNLASSFLNGRIYSLIGVGSAVSAGNISATESWVNGRTNAY